MSATKTETLTQSAHATTCNLSEGTRQAACNAAGGVQSTVKAAEIVFYRACLASAIANGLQPGCFIRALQDLRADGV